MPLNPSLYRALSSVFKRGVRIQKAGERMVYTGATSTITGKKTIVVQSGRGGEDYKICCPFCNDRRFRLEISHRWNTRDEKTEAYFGVAFLHCYNDGCDLNRDAPWRKRLDCHERLTEMTKPYIARNRPIVYEEPMRERTPIKLPDKCIPITKLDAGHKAIVYLEKERQFNVDYLARWFQVLFCLDDPNPMVAGRIVIPIYMNEQLVGWQARYIGKPISDNVPKYYTCPGTQRNQILYNYDSAKKAKFAVLVEGPTDAWRVGINGIASLGSSVSSTHIQLMQAAWRDGGLGLMLDPDYVHKPSHDPKEPSPYDKLKLTLSDPTLFKNGMLEIVLPDGTDPGSMDRTELWKLIANVAQQKGYTFP
jgi:hypothetical protein